MKKNKIKKQIRHKKKFKNNIKVVNVGRDKKKRKRNNWEEKNKKERNVVTLEARAFYSKILSPTFTLIFSFGRLSFSGPVEKTTGLCHFSLPLSLNQTPFPLIFSHIFYYFFFILPPKIISTKHT